MANMLDKYADTIDEISVPADEFDGKAVKRQDISRDELENIIKRLRKKLRKQKERRKAAEKAAAERSEKQENSSRVMGFLSKLGDAICKAVPKVLTTLVTLAFGCFFKAKFAGKSPLFA